MKILPLLVDLLGDAAPCFIFDAAGQLVFSSTGIPIDAPFCSGSSVIGADLFSLELARPTAAWLTYISDSLQSLTGQRVLSITSRLYPNNRPLTSEYVYSPIKMSSHSDNELLELIRLAELAAADEREYIESKLRDVGVVPIPALERPSQEYYEFRPGVEPSASVYILQQGWLRNGRVLRKTLVSAGDPQAIANQK